MDADEMQVGGDHYKKMGVEPWEVVDSWPYQQRIGYYRGCALKYVMRLGSKDAGPQEALKGAHYLEKLAETLSDIAMQEIRERQHIESQQTMQARHEARLRAMHEHPPSTSD